MKALQEGIFFREVWTGGAITETNNYFSVYIWARQYCFKTDLKKWEPILELIVQKVA